VNTLRINAGAGKPARAAGDCKCELCGHAFVLPRLGEPRVCGGCREELARALPDAHEEALALLADVNALRDGTGRYAGLTDEERNEQCDALGTALAGRRYNPTAAEDRKLRDSFRRMTDQQVIDYISGAPADAAGYQAFAICVAAEELARRMERRDAAAWAEGQAEGARAETDE